MPQICSSKKSSFYDIIRFSIHSTPPITPVCSSPFHTHTLPFLSHDLSTIILIFFYWFPSYTESNRISCRKHRKSTFSWDLLIFERMCSFGEIRKLLCSNFNHFPHVHRSDLHPCSVGCDVDSSFSFFSCAHYSRILTTILFPKLPFAWKKFFGSVNCNY